MLFNANLLLITERYREEDLDESSNYSASRPDGKWVEYTDTGDMVARIKKSEKLGLPLESGRDSDNYDEAAASDNSEDNNKVGDRGSLTPAWCSIFDKQNLEFFIFIYLLETRLTN